MLGVLLSSWLADLPLAALSHRMGANHRRCIVSIPIRSVITRSHDLGLGRLKYSDLEFPLQALAYERH